MKEIRIGPWAQFGLFAAFAGAVLGVLAWQAPEIKRYLKVRQM